MSDNGSTGGAEGEKGLPLRVFHGIVGGMNAAGSCWIVVLMLMINAEAIGRSAFNSPIIGVLELIQISIVGIVFLQLADSLRRGVLTRSDGLFNTVMARRPAIGHLMGLITYVLGAVFMLLILMGSFPLLVEAWEEDHYIGVEGMFTAPMWPIGVVVNIAVLVTTVQFLIFAYDHLKKIGSGSEGAR